MKKIIILITTFLSGIVAYGQATSLNENMNTYCITGNHAPNGWLTYNPQQTTLTVNGNWTCDPASGRASTPGISCTGLYSGSYHIDTSILISPALNLSGYSGDIFINFDTKTTMYNLGAKMDIFLSADSSMGYATGDTATVYAKTTSMNPLFDMTDEANWVTHQVDLTPYKGILSLRVGFRYVSANGTTGSKWYLDNVMTTTTPLPPASVREISYETRSLSGTVIDENLTINCHATEEGNYNVALFDITGRAIMNKQLHLNAGFNTKTISGCNVPAGMYIVTLGNESSYTTARVQAW